MIKISFDQGSGSFEILLEETEPLPEKWNVDGVVVYRAMPENKYVLVKDYRQIL